MLRNLLLVSFLLETECIFIRNACVDLRAVLSAAVVLTQTGYYHAKSFKTLSF
jgi:hypothetical protein